MAFAAAGIAFLALGTALEVWAVLELGWRRAAELTDAPPDPALPRLVLGGPFRLVRHPQSLGLLLILVGTGLAVRTTGIWVMAVLAGAIVIAMARRHDRELTRDCGEAYARYRRTVPLLLPSLRR